jgi:predicted ATPase
MISFYEPQDHHHSLVSLQGYDTGVSALSFDACCLWALGYPEQALQRSEEAIALARELDHPFSLADALAFGGCMYNKMRGDARALKDHAEELMRYSKEKAMPGWLATGTVYRGEAVAMLGKFQEGIAQICEGMTAEKTIGIRLYLPGSLCTLAKAQAHAGLPVEGLTTLADALAMVEETGERLWEAELYRVRAELLLMQGEYDAVEAEASFQEAIEVARNQSARSWELRATTGLARLWQELGKREEARQVLAPIHAWFTEGFETPDLREAEALLGELS